MTAIDTRVKTVSSTSEVDILNSDIKRSIPRDWVPMTYIDYKREFDSSSQDVNGWLSLIKEELYSNPSVEDIFVSIEDSNVDVWVVIPERDLTILHQIVEREWELLKAFVSGEHSPFLIDFHIIYRCGRNVEDLAPTRAIRLPRQVQ